LRRRGSFEYDASDGDRVWALESHLKLKARQSKTASPPNSHRVETGHISHSHVEVELPFGDRDDLGLLSNSFECHVMSKKGKNPEGINQENWIVR
jgi:hypothetical protein